MISRIESTTATMADIQGLQFVPEFVSEEEETELLAAIGAIEPEKWCCDLKRRTMHFGYKYNYDQRIATVKIGNGNLPEWQTALKERLEAKVGRTFDQLIVNEYHPSQGISKHIDAPHAFGDTIISLSLGSTSTMVFRRGDIAVPVFLPRRSIVILQDDARYKWTHEIPPRKSDVGSDGKRVLRGTRVSITYRFLRA